MKTFGGNSSGGNSQKIVNTAIGIRVGSSGNMPVVPAGQFAIVSLRVKVTGGAFASFLVGGVAVFEVNAPVGSQFTAYLKSGESLGTSNLASGAIAWSAVYYAET